MPSMRQARGLLVCCLVASLTGCAEPPARELSQAQGALDAARAAGAADYAADEFTAASDMLTRAHQAVAERDYRAALSHALASSARAQAAAKAAVEGRVRSQRAADQVIGEVSAAVAQVQARLSAPEARRMPLAARRRAQQAVGVAEPALAAARSAVAKGELAAVSALGPHRESLAAALAGLAPAPAARPRPRS
jgi:hypothetical protein